MEYAALVTWIVAAALGLYMLATWVSHGGTRSTAGEASHFRPPVVFGHFLLAAAGLVLWVIYLVSDSTGLAWTAFVVLVVVALVGDTLVLRWYKDRKTGGWGASTASLPSASPTRRSTRSATAEPAAGHGASLAEQHVAPAVVATHGVFAGATLVLVLLTALGVGS